MKKLLLLLIIPFLSFGQITVNKDYKHKKRIKPELIGEIRSMGTTYLECNKYTSKENLDYYSFTFIDAEFSDSLVAHSFGFYDDDNAFEKFYTLCLDGFKKNDNDFSISLNEGELGVVYENCYSSCKRMFFEYTEKGVSRKSHLMNKDNVKFLFGKNQKFKNLYNDSKEKKYQN